MPSGMQMPRPEQREGHDGSSHCGPDQPSSQRHWATAGRPGDGRPRIPRRRRALGSPRSVAFAFAAAPAAALAAAPAAALVVDIAEGVAQTPWPEQLEVQSRTEQSSPPKPLKQVHRPSAPQVPRPLQSPGHSTPEQSSPVRPSAQAQAPSTHMPNGEWQSSGHSRSQ
jgi:hypothetical protein